MMVWLWYDGMDMGDGVDVRMIRWMWMMVWM